MTNEQILKQVMVKASQSCWGGNRFRKCTEKQKLSVAKNRLQNDGLFEMIFSHAFAKAFWGEEGTGIVCEGGVETAYEKMDNGWMHHLQQMVLEEEPLTYLARFL